MIKQPISYLYNKSLPQFQFLSVLVFTFFLLLSTYTSSSIYAQDNNAVQCDGFGDYFTSPSLGVELGERTLEAWVKLNDVDQFGGGVVCIENFPGGFYEDHEGIVYNEISGGGWFFGSGYFQRSAMPGSGVKETSTSEWVHIAFTYKDYDYRMYRNGVLIQHSTDHSLKTFAVTSNIIIGQRHQNAGSQDFNGAIDEARVWNKARSIEEIRRTMHCSCAEMNTFSSNGLLACYTFDDFGADPIVDVTGNGYDLTSFGNPFYEASAAPVAGFCRGIPTLSEWGLINLALLLLTFGTIYLIKPNFSLRE